jgi:hypothetical protein
MPRSPIQRMLGAATLDLSVYEEVEHDPNATLQAVAVVAAVAACQAVGAAGAGPVGIVGAALGQLVGWVVWAGITYLIGSMVFGGTATWGELMRTLGFAQAPGVLALLAVVPLLGWFVLPVVAVWTLVAGIVAIRQALDVGTGKAILTALLGWVVLVVLRVIFL